MPVALDVCVREGVLVEVPVPVAVWDGVCVLVVLEVPVPV